MDNRLHAILVKIRLKFIALFCSHHKAMPHASTLIIRLWQDDFGIFNLFAVKLAKSKAK